MGGLQPPDLNLYAAVLTGQLILFLKRISTAVSFRAKFCSCTLAAEGCLLYWPSARVKQQHGQRDWRQEEAVALAIPHFKSCSVDNNCPGRQWVVKRKLSNALHYFPKAFWQKCSHFGYYRGRAQSVNDISS